ncbi:MAG: polyphosphate:AMP phosphotransferase [Sandaracinaceae bacterium]|nr:polyphosphate:AMP phosphotransferase [Sandaracinaceae bacterium]
MFESAELGHQVSKADYEAQVPAVRERLLNAQYELLESRKFSLVVVVGGVDGAGKGDTINLLRSWLDPRHVRVHGMGPPSEDERGRPPIARFWARLPPRGKTAVFMGSWYTAPIVDRVFRRTKPPELDTAMEHVRHFERMLTQERVVLVKLWFHLSKEEQRQRLRRLEKDPKQRWRVTETDWKHFELYDRFRRISARALRETSTDFAPWLVVSGNDARYRQLTVGRAIATALEQALAAPSAPAPAPPVPPSASDVDGLTVLDPLDLSKSIAAKPYRSRLEKLQGELALATRDPKFVSERALVCVFEGADAAGKGGAIRRVAEPLDARICNVVPVAAPTDEEAARPYLWRFWRHIPGRGRVVIFDRSWYGRVLVERVEGFAPPSEWARAYSEINELEEHLVEHGIRVAKLWLQISPEEQLRRFEERQQTGFKQFKITEEDWRNREKAPQYRLAVNDMIERTSTELAPWTLVEAEDKRYARVKVLETILETLSR